MIKKLTQNIKNKRMEKLRKAEIQKYANKRGISVEEYAEILETSMNMKESYDDDYSQMNTLARDRMLEASNFGEDVKNAVSGHHIYTTYGPVINTHVATSYIVQSCLDNGMTVALIRSSFLKERDYFIFEGNGKLLQESQISDYHSPIDVVIIQVKSYTEYLQINERYLNNSKQKTIIVGSASSSDFNIPIATVSCGLFSNFKNAQNRINGMIGETTDNFQSGQRILAASSATRYNILSIQPIDEHYVLDRIAFTYHNEELIIQNNKDKHQKVELPIYVTQDNDEVVAVFEKDMNGWLKITRSDHMILKAF